MVTGRNPRTGDYAYKAEGCWNLSRDSSTYYAGFNADSYAMDATAIYVQQYYSLDSPPVPRRYLAKGSGDPGASPNGDGGGEFGGKVFAGAPPGCTYKCSFTSLCGFRYSGITRHMAGKDRYIQRGKIIIYHKRKENE